MLYQRDLNSKKEPNRNLELKNSINEMRNALESIGNNSDGRAERTKISLK